MDLVQSHGCEVYDHALFVLELHHHVFEFLL